VSQGTTIEWTDATWNPVRGCTRISEGCRHCYAEQMAARFSGRNPQTGKPMWGAGFATSKGLEPRWTGKVALIADQLDWPLRWKGSKKAKAEGRPSRIFVNSTSDLFHEKLTVADILRVAAVISLAKRHVLQSLTKRAEVMRLFSEGMAARSPTERAQAYAHALEGVKLPPGVGLSDLCLDWPLPNWWMGVSTENQETADERIPHLLNTPAAVRFISAEPLIGPIDLKPYLTGVEEHGIDMTREPGSKVGACVGWTPPLDLVIAGGESGRGDVRPPHPDWFRRMRDDCSAAEVPFFFKQWGAYGPNDTGHAITGGTVPGSINLSGCATFPDGQKMNLLGKDVSGHLLDGRAHREMPA
jgi:protein gp37